MNTNYTLLYRRECLFRIEQDNRTIRQLRAHFRQLTGKDLETVFWAGNPFIQKRQSPAALFVWDPSRRGKGVPHGDRFGAGLRLGLIFECPVPRGGAVVLGQAVESAAKGGSSISFEVIQGEMQQRNSRWSTVSDGFMGIRPLAPEYGEQGQLGKKPNRGRDKNRVSQLEQRIPCRTQAPINGLTKSD
jgi:hypothetical protein